MKTCLFCGEQHGSCSTIDLSDMRIIPFNEPYLSKLKEGPQPVCMKCNVRVLVEMLGARREIEEGIEDVLVDSIRTFLPRGGVDMNDVGYLRRTAERMIEHFNRRAYVFPCRVCGETGHCSHRPKKVKWRAKMDSPPKLVQKAEPTRDPDADDA